MAASQDKLDVGRMFVIGLGGIIFTYAVVLALEGLYYARVGVEQEKKILAVPYTEALEAKAAGKEYLSEYGWIDEEAGTVHIPIEDAKSLYLEGLR